MLKKMSAVVLFCLCVWSLFGVFGEFVSVMEGDSVTLSVNLTETQRKEGISWKFGPEITIAEIEVGGNKISLYEDRADWRFRDRLKLNNHTGSLTITNTTTTDAGLYKLINTNKKTQLNIFNLTVYAHLPVPVIYSVCPQNSSSISRCVLLCSVLNMRDVSLSWYKGNSLLSSISVSDLNIRLSLSLEVEYQDTNTYRCVLNNPITNQTEHLNIKNLCQPCSENFCCCGFTEAVIRLVVSALVGVATFVVLVFDMKTRGHEQKRMRSGIQLNDG